MMPHHMVLFYIRKVSWIVQLLGYSYDTGTVKYIRLNTAGRVSSQSNADRVSSKTAYFVSMHYVVFSKADDWTRQKSFANDCVVVMTALKRTIYAQIFFIRICCLFAI